MSYVIRYVKPSYILQDTILSDTFIPREQDNNGISVWSLEYYLRINQEDPIGELRRNHGDYNFSASGKLILIDITCLERNGLRVIPNPSKNNPAHTRIETFPTDEVE